MVLLRIVPGMLVRPLHNRYFDVDRFAELVRRQRWLRPDVALPVLFAAYSVLSLSSHYPETVGVDARIYVRAAAAFLGGGDPWAAFASDPGGTTWHFAALPPTVLAFVPLTYMTENAAVWTMLWLTVFSAYFIVRSLKLPVWWLLFPPLVQGVYVANPQILLLAMLLSGSSVLRALAPMLKIYALAPLVGERWMRALAIAVAMLVGSYLVAPDLWATYFARSGEIAARVFEEAAGGYSATGTNTALLVATLGGLLALAVVDWRAAGWLAGPALVPASQFHLSTMAMPVLARTQTTLLIALFAIPIRGLPSGIVAVYGTWRAYQVVRARRTGGLGRPAEPRSPGGETIGQAR